MFPFTCYIRLRSAKLICLHLLIILHITKKYETLKYNVRKNLNVFVVLRQMLQTLTCNCVKNHTKKVK